MAFTPDEAYREAAKIDARLALVLADHPITGRSIRGWRIFLRTIESTLNLLDTVIEHAASKPKGARSNADPQ